MRFDEDDRRVVEGGVVFVRQRDRDDPVRAVRGADTDLAENEVKLLRRSLELLDVSTPT